MEYRNISNLVRKQTRNIHRTEQQEIANSCKENPKKFWNYVNSRRKVRNPIGDLVYKDATGMELKADTDEKRAKALGNFFSSVFCNESADYFESLPDIYCNKPMDTIQISTDDITKRLANLNINKSSGPDNLHPRILYEVRNEIKYHILSN